MAGKKNKPIGDMTDEELMSEIKNVVKPENIIEEVGKNSPVIKAAFEAKTGEGSNN